MFYRLVVESGYNAATWDVRFKIHLDEGFLSFEEHVKQPTPSMAKYIGSRIVGDK